MLHRSSDVLVPSALPALPLSAWQATKDTLQLYTQIAGKLRTKLAPAEPEWAHCALFVTARGLTTGPMPYRDRLFQIDFDLVKHEFVVTASDGTTQSLKLASRSVANFYGDVFALLEEMRILVDVNPIPQEVADPVSFEKDTVHASYDAEAVGRFFQVLAFADSALKKHRAPFRGRHTPVHFFWGGFDLAYARYSGRPAQPPPGAGWLMRTSMDAEEIYAGFWPGDARLPEPAFGVYIYPKPDGVENAEIKPVQAQWNAAIGLFVLRYEDVRVSASPVDTLLEFLESTYEACATAAGWER